MPDGLGQRAAAKAAQAVSVTLMTGPSARLLPRNLLGRCLHFDEEEFGEWYDSSLRQGGQPGALAPRYVRGAGAPVCGAAGAANAGRSSRAGR
ncbi:hypothetical protein [Streptomyces sp. NPDC088762]|uniref:hypothetical protein n=1 Tax=Streptomyces sp. NPDC088762 TaxID=3365891 RepID=UPI003802D978